MACGSRRVVSFSMLFYVLVFFNSLAYTAFFVCLGLIWADGWAPLLSWIFSGFASHLTRYSKLHTIESCMHGGVRDTDRHWIGGNNRDSHKIRPFLNTNEDPLVTNPLYRCPRVGTFLSCETVHGTLVAFDRNGLTGTSNTSRTE